MKRLLRFAASACIFALILTVSVFAGTESGLSDVQTNFDSIPSFVTTGNTPDISGASIKYTFNDGTVINYQLTNSLLTANMFQTPGLKNITIDKYGRRIKISFVAVDEGKRIFFTDLSKKHWAYTAIRRCASAEFLSGTSQNVFGTEKKMTRAQFCQMLYNVYKNDSDIFSAGKNVSFSDVAQGAWYYDAVMKCACAGIVEGVGAGKFNPQSPIRRQDAALMMMRIIMGRVNLERLNAKEVVAAARAAGIPANDFDQTSDYAKRGVAASLGVIFYGDNLGNINPQKYITRAECAAFISNYFFKGYTDPVEPRYLVYLSPSNQMHNQYAGVNATEGQQMNIVAEYTKALLEQLGYDVFIADINTSIHKTETGTYRAQEAKEMGADCYVAIHSNATGAGNNGSRKGTICFYNGNNAGAAELSQAILDRVTPLTGHGGYIKEDMISLGPNGKPYAEVANPEMANLIIEVEYHDYAPYAKWITENVKPLGEAIAHGIDDYFNSLG